MDEHDSGAATQSRRVMALLHASGLMVVVALILAGMVESIVRDGCIPGVRFGYFEQHSKLLESTAYSRVLSQLRMAATLDFDNALAQTQFLRAAYGANDAESATCAIRGLLRLTPRDPELNAKLAGLLLDLGEVEQAVNHSRFAVALEPSSANYRCLHGTALLSAGQLPEAATAFRAALRLDPESMSAMQALAFPLKGY